MYRRSLRLRTLGERLLYWCKLFRIECLVLQVSENKGKTIYTELNIATDVSVKFGYDDDHVIYYEDSDGAQVNYIVKKKNAFILMVYTNINEYISGILSHTSCIWCSWKVIQLSSNNPYAWDRQTSKVISQIHLLFLLFFLALHLLKPKWSQICLTLIVVDMLY